MRGALLFRAELDLHVLAERRAAALVDDARGGADVRVGEGRDVLLEEVDEPALALQEREERQRAVGEPRPHGLGFVSRAASFGGRAARGRRGHGVAHGRGARGEGPVEEHTEEARPREEEAGAEGHGVHGAPR